MFSASSNSEDRLEEAENTNERLWVDMGIQISCRQHDGNDETRRGQEFVKQMEIYSTRSAVID